MRKSPGTRKRFPFVYLRFLHPAHTCADPDIYSHKSVAMAKLLKEHVPAERFDGPTVNEGMFLRVRLPIERHPDFPAKDPETLQIFGAMITEKVSMA